MHCHAAADRHTHAHTQTWVTAINLHFASLRLTRNVKSVLSLKLNSWICLDILEDRYK